MYSIGQIYDFNCKSGSSPHCDCVQSITVEKVDAFLELKMFNDVKNALSTNQALPHDYMNSYILDFTIRVTSRESLSYHIARYYKKKCFQNISDPRFLLIIL